MKKVLLLIAVTMIGLAACNLESPEERGKRRAREQHKKFLKQLEEEEQETRRLLEIIRN